MTTLVSILPFRILYPVQSQSVINIPCLFLIFADLGEELEWLVSLVLARVLETIYQRILFTVVDYIADNSSVTLAVLYNPLSSLKV